MALFHTAHQHGKQTASILSLVLIHKKRWFNSLVFTSNSWVTRELVSEPWLWRILTNESKTPSSTIFQCEGKKLKHLKPFSLRKKNQQLSTHLDTLWCVRMLEKNTLIKMQSKWRNCIPSREMFSAAAQDKPGAGKASDRLYTEKGTSCLILFSTLKEP